MLLFNRYEYNPQTDLIGKGGFSRVYKAFDKKFDRYVALKVYKTNEISERYSPIAEIQRVIQLEHPNISRYIDIEELEKEDSFGQVEKVKICVMELLEGGNFENYYNRNKDIAVFKKLLTDVLHGLSYLHRNGIIHRDIKPANILIKQNPDGPVAKITDFGISKRSDSSTNSSSSALIVSIPYMAPEQLNAKKYGIEERIHYNIDLWSLGVTVYEVLTGKALFKNNDHDSSEQIMTNIISNELPEKLKLLPQPFSDFVSMCVIKDAKERVKSADELLLVLQESSSEISNTKSVNLSKEVSKNGKAGATAIQNAEQAVTVPKPVTDETALTGNKDNAAASINDTVQISSERFDNGYDGEVGSSNNLAEDTKIITPLPVDTSPDEKGKKNKEDQTADETRIVMIPDSQKGDTENTSVYTNYEGSDDETRIVSINNDNKPDELISGSVAIKPEDQRNQLSLEEEASQPEDDTKIIQEPDLTQMAPVNRIAKPFETETGEKKKDEGIAMVTTPKSEKEHTRITLFNRYDYYPVVDLIGKGGFSRVYKAFDQKLSRWVALKIYKTSEFSDRYSPIAEIKRVINLDHSNICRYLDIEEIEKVNPFGETEKIQVCVMELLDSGNFSEYFNNTGRDLNVMKKLLQDVLHGISYLHKNGIIHRDIKPANILIKKTVEGPVAKITDFGISKLSDSVNNNSSSALIVSIPYMAPEQLNAKKYGINEKISSNLDLWSLGVTIYEVITGKVLFKNNEQDSSEQIMANIMAQELPDKINELSEPFRSIVTHCMVKNAHERAQKAEELLVMLNSSGKLETAVPIVPAQSAETIIKTASPGKAPYNEEIKKTENSISIPEKPDEQVSKRKIRIALDTPEIEKRAKKQISVLKICIAAASVLLLIASFFYFTVSNNEKKSTNKITDKDSTRRPSLVLPGKPQTDGSKKSENVNTK